MVLSSLVYPSFISTSPLILRKVPLQQDYSPGSLDLLGLLPSSSLLVSLLPPHPPPSFALIFPSLLFISLFLSSSARCLPHLSLAFLISSSLPLALLIFTMGFSSSLPSFIFHLRFSSAFFPSSLSSSPPTYSAHSPPLPLPTVWFNGGVIMFILFIILASGR